MLRLRLKNPVPDRLAHHAPFPHMNPDYPLKPRIQPQTNREFRILSLPQKDGSFVASIVEDPDIIVYDKSRKAAEEKATRKFLRRPDPHAYMNHALVTTGAVTIEMEYDDECDCFVTYVKELDRISTFGETELKALDSTAEMIRGYIKSMEANRKKIPLAAPKLVELKRIVGCIDGE